MFTSTFVCTGLAFAQDATLCARLKAATEAPAVAAAHWGVSVTTLDGAAVCGVNEAQLFRPGSNNKIFTGAAALALMGADARFATRVMAEGTLVGAAALTGNLLLLGGGDASFGTHDLPYSAAKPGRPETATIADIEALAAQVAATGLRRVSGDVVGDDTWFASEPYPSNWAADDLLWGYGAPVSALSVHDNEVEIDVERGPEPGAPTVVTMAPAVPYYVVRNEALTRGPGRDCAALGFERALGTRVLKVFGGVAPNPAGGAIPCAENIAIADPALYAAMAFKAALARHGVQVVGVARAAHAEMKRVGPVIRPEPLVSFMLTRSVLPKPYDAGAQPLACEAQYIAGGPKVLPRTEVATHVSAPLSDDLRYTFKVSNNLHAETMLRNLGAYFSCEHTQSAGVAVVREFALHAGVEAKDMALEDGSGLSTHDLVTPRALTRMLAYAATQPWFATYKDALPAAGSDGTLTTRLADLKGRVSAKTGTLGESRALSGYVNTGAGTTLVFSILVDDHLPGNAADRTAMDAMVAMIAE